MALRPLFLEIPYELLLGRRGMVKAATLWLPLSVLLLAGGFGVTDALLVLLAVASWKQVCILGNDLIDAREDAASGKRRWITRLPRGLNVLLVALIGAAGVAVLAAGAAPPAAWAAWMGATILGILYSLRPLRLKERGAGGILAYSGSAALAFVVFPCAWAGAEWPALVALCPAVLLDKWVNLHFHQVVDFESDRQQGIQTYATTVGLPRARRTLFWAAALASVCLAIAGGFAILQSGLPRALPGGMCVLAGLGAWWFAARGRRHSGSALLRELPPLYLAITTVVLRLLPLTLLTLAAVDVPSLWSIVALAGAITLIELAQMRRYRYD